jgi:aryl sulfotransferase
MSFHNHALSFTPEMVSALDQAGLEDVMVGRPYPRALADPAQHFHRWLTESAVPGDEDGLPSMSFFRFERSWRQAGCRQSGASFCHSPPPGFPCLCLR